MTFLNNYELQHKKRSWLSASFPKAPWKLLTLLFPFRGRHHRMTAGESCVLPGRAPGGTAPSAAWEPQFDFPSGGWLSQLLCTSKKLVGSFPDRHCYFSFPDGETLLNSNSVTNSLNMKRLLLVQNTFKVFIPAMHLVTLTVFSFSIQEGMHYTELCNKKTCCLLSPKQ